MDAARTAVLAVTFVILGTTAVSGPLVSSIDIPPDKLNTGRMACDISGSVDVDIQELPAESFVLDKQKFGHRSYALQSDPLLIDVSDVRGCPLISYELRVPELGTFSFKNYYPTEGGEGIVAMSMVTATYEEDRIQKESYDARLGVKVTGDRNRTLVTENITIPVGR